MNVAASGPFIKLEVSLPFAFPLLMDDVVYQAGEGPQSQSISHNCTSNSLSSLGRVMSEGEGVRLEFLPKVAQSLE